MTENEIKLLVKAYALILSWPEPTEDTTSPDDLGGLAEEVAEEAPTQDTTPALFYPEGGQ